VTGAETVEIGADVASASRFFCFLRLLELGSRETVAAVVGERCQEIAVTLPLSKTCSARALPVAVLYSLSLCLSRASEMWTKKDESGENEESDQLADSVGASDSVPPLLFLLPFLAREAITTLTLRSEQKKKMTGSKSLGPGYNNTKQRL
jgi:hypothetical protein